jgi:hypothetical protein
MRDRLTCADCGRRMEQVSTSLPQGIAKCQACRAVARGPRARRRRPHGNLFCATCGKQMWKGKTSGPQGQARCQPCRRASPPPKPQRKAPRLCIGCGTEVVGANNRKWCSDQCRFRRVCEVCGAEYSGKSPQRACSRACGVVLRGMVPGGRARRRTRRGVTVERVDPRVVYERDHWRCHLCKKKVWPSRRRWDPLGPSLDHLVPLSLGGEHSYANVALAHLRCNVRKGTRAMGEQLALC